MILPCKAQLNEKSCCKSENNTCHKKLDRKRVGELGFKFKEWVGGEVMGSGCIGKAGLTSQIGHKEKYSLPTFAQAHCAPDMQVIQPEQCPCTNDVGQF